ncbi:MAG: HAMP domain-containing histidine kinase [Lachnospiraceae bacterium]|nr:HAMP domain-containing histidine kinase [Lachnospiraceae bacterium]
MKKNKIFRQTWVKLLAAAVATVSAIAILFCGFFAIMFGVVDEFGKKPGEIRDMINRQLLSGYMIEMYRESGLASNWPGDSEQPVWDSLDGGSIRYTVVEDTGRIVYSNDASVDEEHCLYSDEVTADMGVSGAGRDDFWSIFAKERIYSQGPENETVRIVNAVYDRKTGLFYWKDETGDYYRVSMFRWVSNEENVPSEVYDLTEGESGSQTYVNENGVELSAETVEEKWEKGEGFLLLNDEVNAVFEQDTDVGDLAIRRMDVVPEDKIIETDWGECFYNGEEDVWLNYRPANEATQTRYEIYMDVGDSIQKNVTLNCGMGDYFPQAEALSSFLINFRHTCGWYLAFSVILFVAAFTFLMKAAGRRVEDQEIHICFVDKIPFEILSLAVLGMVVGFVALGVLMVELFYESSVSFSLAFAGGMTAMCLCAGVVLVYCMSFAVRIKKKSFWRYTLLHYLLTPFRWAKQVIMAKTPLFFKAVAAFAAVAILEAIGVSACIYDPEAMALGFILFKLVEFTVLLWLVYQLYRIREGGRRIAAGDYSHPIDTSHMLGELKKHAENINNVGNGISQAVEARMKSERFKTELITNVSHDIKTPLTSIINYVDLIKKEQVDNPKVEEYVEILDRQSARLKKLIEDLMEASKASTGNLQVHLEVCDATVMLTQVIGEFEDRAKANDLELVVESPDPPANIMADGRHLWRIIDNFMSNICKYAMPGTRVYIDLEKFHGMVIMTFRNISRSRLNITSEELMERFVRGDSSRNTEGNGLGLSIAQSLTDLMNGNLALQIDGDLFKVILSFEECPDEKNEESKISS